MSPLHRDVTCDVAVLGAGLTGALLAHALSRDGVDVVVVDKRGVGAGSTSANTALVQYEIDVPLYRLIAIRGEKDAVACYRLCREAIHRLRDIIKGLDSDCGWVGRSSLLLAVSESELSSLRREFRARQRFGFNVEYFDPRAIRDRFPFNGRAAIYSHEAAELDPLCLTCHLLLKARGRGARLCGPAVVRAIEPGRGSVTLRMDRDRRIRCRKLVVAAGYESIEFLRRKVVHLKSTYVLTTEPVADLSAWFEKCLIWEARRPYHYLRTTSDQRLMIGGRDEPFLSVKKRDAAIERKSALLAGRLRRMFPDIPVVPAFTWAGTFGDTRDGLPYIGSLPNMPDVLYALCYGANGINFGVIAAGVVLDWLHGRPNRELGLFVLDRGFK